MPQDKQISIGKIRWKLFLLGVFKIPMIGFVRPKLLSLDDEQVAVKIRLRRRSRNHLKSMYFGALAVGADLSAGVHAFYFSEKMGKPVSLAFKGMSGEFLQRAETDVVFKSSQGAQVWEAMQQSLQNQERINLPIEIIAYNTAHEAVAKFELILSVRVKA